MAKEKNQFMCSDCGHTEPKWMGRCPGCGAWNSFSEFRPAKLKLTSKRAAAPSRQEPVILDEIEVKEGARKDTGVRELNRVLGGGLMEGSAVLIGGEPGIGKSTLMLQTARSLAKESPVLYVSGEESAAQIGLRAKRLDIQSRQIFLLAETDLGDVLEAAEKISPGVLIIDSVQTLLNAETGAVPGTVNQIKSVGFEIIAWARAHKCAVFFVAHVTKEGVIAGPRVMEHMVDTVLYFEQSGSEVRFLRSTKNRFGSIDEVGLFRMTAKGLVQVSDPSSLFLVQRSEGLPPGIATVPVYEGSRVFLVEIQALVIPAKGSLSRVFSDKIESSRVSRMSAVLEKHLSLRFSDQDIYVNVAGGIKLSEPAVDLPLALALYSSRTGISLPGNCVAAGEMSLAGEIRPVAQLDRRVKTAGEMGFDQFYGPRDKTVPQLQGVKTLRETVSRLFQNPSKAPI